ncbi:Malonamoyl-CoA synthetase vrtB like protein [Verticillium longisporum]|uniref:Malonamoyl-CoA synthetase vrtB like protein n=1 Tax=Verticillium longisporum TaxID=100787 RepID=A0A8I2ZUX7_VERLO|nr:Malonamoyl-CoA synthetase vrtB like protein [Verticillium longisporum]
MAVNGHSSAEVSSAPTRELWRHPDPTSTPLWAFTRRVNEKYGRQLNDYPAVYQWSIDNVAAFWEEVWHFSGVKASKSFDEVLPKAAPMYPRPDFFAGARLNFAENLLFPVNVDVSPDAVAIITTTELGNPVSTTWAELRHAVRRCSNALRAHGVTKDDVVAGYVSNHVQALVASLSAASVGAIWTGISPDNGVLFADNGTVYNGKEWSSTSKTTEIVGALKDEGLALAKDVKTVVEYERFLQSSSDDKALTFEQLPPAHPLYILYSSGTTGLPKAIHHLHCSMTSASRMLYYTTTSWMMWHWSISALAVGASLVLYSGSPFKPHGYLSLPRLLSELKVTHFGTSAAYLTALEANQVRPVRDEPSLDLSHLEAIYSTASPLPPSTFNFVYEAFPPHVNLASITGGTDIISLFGAPSPLLPVRTGEIQCAGLGMAIRALDSLTGDPLPAANPGDLACVRPFPSQPLTFFGPGGDAKYRAAYFERFADVCGAAGPVWHHGDFVRVPDPSTGSLVMLGRSDGVLKPAGVRFGSAEIYNVLTRFFAGEVADAVCVGRRRETDTDETVCLFVVMEAGKVFDEDVRARIQRTVRTELSPRHVPGVVEECGGGVPKTGNGKKIEVAVKQILSGMAVQTNASVANPEALDWFRAWAASH